MLVTIVTLALLCACNGQVDERFRTGSGEAPKQYPRFSTDSTTVLGSEPHIPTPAPSDDCCYEYIFDCEDAPQWGCDPAVEPKVCGTSCNENWKCFCDYDVEGVQVCWQDDMCQFASVCTMDADCLSDEVCVQTCCDEPRCMKECEKPFEETPQPTKQTKGPTKQTKSPTNSPTDPQPIPTPTQQTLPPSRQTKSPTDRPTNKPTYHTKGPTRQTSSPTNKPTPFPTGDNTCTCENQNQWFCGQIPELCHTTPAGQFDCYCVTQVETGWDPINGNACVQDAWCSAAPNCATDSDCPAGFECIPNTCCPDSPNKCLRCCDDDNPTPKPTASPTDPQPIPTPTEKPTPRPTVEPTTSPTDPQPIPTPTQETRAPSRKTGSPTHKTVSPSERPTEKPSAGPTPEPTDSPTDPQPIPTPTRQTRSPSRQTKNPTRQTEGPTNRPTEKPIQKPTEKPTQKPIDPPQECFCEEPFECVNWFQWPQDAKCGDGYIDPNGDYYECKCVRPHPEDPNSSAIGIHSVCIREAPDRACTDRVFYPLCNPVDFSCPTGYHCIQDHCCGNIDKPICAPCCEAEWNYDDQWN